MADVRECLTLEDLGRFANATRTVLVDREVIGYAVTLANATREPGRYGLERLEGYIEYGANPRGPIGLGDAGRAPALLPGPGPVSVGDIRDLAPDVLRHRLVLSYDALADNVSADELLDDVLAAVTEPPSDHMGRGVAA